MFRQHRRDDGDGVGIGDDGHDRLDDGDLGHDRGPTDDDPADDVHGHGQHDDARHVGADDDGPDDHEHDHGHDHDDGHDDHDDRHGQHHGQ
jgi:hypothetical protein